MKSLPLILIIVLAALLAIYFRRNLQSNNRQTEQASNTAQGQTRTSDQPPVTVKVTPMEFGKNASVWKFDIIFDTHSGSLDEDPTKVITLKDDRGNVYWPISWEGAGPGGHHREGVLLFSAITPSPAYIELKVVNVGGVPERLFTWNLE